jgi:riboflavin biosynthesis pyrimidine reductase
MLAAFVHRPEGTPVSHLPDTLEALRPPAADPLALYRDATRTPRGQHPWVLANFVAGVDGAISVEGRVGALSSPTDKAVFRLLRSLADVVLVGAGTFRSERYAPSRLADHLRDWRQRQGRPPVPPIAVVSGSLDLDLEAPVFSDAEVRTLVVTTAASDPAARERVSQVADVVIAGESRLDPAAALRQLRQRGHGVVLCEGGGVLNAELLAAGLLDELCLTVSPHVGGDPSRIVADAPRIPLTGLRLAHVLADRDELYLRYLTGADGG